MSELPFHLQGRPRINVGLPDNTEPTDSAPSRPTGNSILTPEQVAAVDKETDQILARHQRLQGVVVHLGLAQVEDHQVVLDASRVEAPAIPDSTDSWAARLLESDLYESVLVGMGVAKTDERGNLEFILPSEIMDQHPELYTHVSDLSQIPPAENILPFDHEEREAEKEAIRGQKYINLASQRHSVNQTLQATVEAAPEFVEKQGSLKGFLSEVEKLTGKKLVITREIEELLTLEDRIGSTSLKNLRQQDLANLIAFAKRREKVLDNLAAQYNDPAFRKAEIKAAVEKHIRNSGGSVTAKSTSARDRVAAGVEEKYDEICRQINEAKGAVDKGDTVIDPATLPGSDQKTPQGQSPSGTVFVAPEPIEVLGQNPPTLEAKPLGDFPPLPEEPPQPQLDEASIKTIRANLREVQAAIKKIHDSDKFLTDVPTRERLVALTTRESELHDQLLNTSRVNSETLARVKQGAQRKVGGWVAQVSEILHNNKD